MSNYEKCEKEISSDNKNLIIKWIYNNFPEIGNIELKDLNTLHKRLNVCIQCIKAYLNKYCSEEFTINSTFTKTLYASIYVNLDINFIDNEKSDIRIYLLKIILLCRGYDCDFNGIYSSNTRKVFKQWCKDNDIKNRKYPYQINSHVWYKLLTIDKKENIDNE